MPNSFSPSPKPGVITDSGAEFSFLKKKKANFKKLFIVACFVFLLLCVFFFSESNEVNMTKRDEE